MSQYSQKLSRKATQKQRAQHFVLRAKIIHGDKYDYSVVEQTFTKQQALVTIICKKCGPFEQLATNHLAGKGCPTCAAKERMRKRYPEHAKARDEGCKICGFCKLKKPLDMFSNAPSMYMGVSGWCKDCENKNRRTKYQTRVRNSNLKKYGLTQAAYENMLEQQGYKCKICAVHFKDAPGVGASTKGVLCVDHDHTTNKVRGLLCSRCNTGLGLFSDNISNLKNAILYLKKADQLGSG